MQEFRSLMMGFYKLGTLRDTKMTSPMVSYFSSDRAIGAVLEKAKGDFGNMLIALPPPSGMTNAKIGMWCNWDFTRESPICSIQVMFAKDKDKAWGFRVDPPHAERAERKHSYWHTQFTRSFQNSGIYFPKCKVDWIDSSTPAYPIALENPGSVRPSDALVYALIAIYGQEVNKDILTLLRKIRCSVSLRAILAQSGK